MGVAPQTMKILMEGEEGDDMWEIIRSDLSDVNLFIFFND